MISRLWAAAAALAIVLEPAVAAGQPVPLQAALMACGTKESTDEKLDCFVAQLRLLSACRGKLEKEEQLACFMELTGVENKPAPPSEGNWMASDTVDKLDDSKTINLGLASSDKASSGYGTQKEAIISFRCRKNVTEVFVIWPSFLGTGKSLSVRWRTDGQPIVTETWSPSTSGSAVFAPRPVDFAKKLLGKKELVFNVEPYNQGAQTVTFAIAGIDEAIKPLRAACNW